jgi:hypothetical protein
MFVRRCTWSNDGSGVAAMMELAKSMSLTLTIIFVAAGEEQRSLWRKTFAK